MHDRDPFRAPRREPKPGTFHRPAHGFGTKPAPEAADLRLSGPKVGEQKLEARRGSAGIAPWRCPNEEKAVTRPVGRLPTRRLTLNARWRRRRASSGRKRLARAARTSPHAGMYTQASTSKVAIMEWITMQVPSESWVMMRAPSKRENLPAS